MFTLPFAYERLDAAWPWNEEAYPVLGRLRDPNQILAFKAHHALGHLHKSVGKIEAMLEPIDHGADASALRGDAVTELVGKSLVDLLRFAKDAGISASELEIYLNTFFGSKDIEAR